MTESELDEEFLTIVFNEVEPPCEAKHQVTTCEGSAAYLITSCHIVFKACPVYVEHPEHGVRVRMERFDCKGCHRPAVDCWTIRPI